MFTPLIIGFLLAHFEEPAKPLRKILTQCPRCGTSLSGKKSCCGQNGAWFGNCGLPGDFDFDYTWNEGIQSCQTTGVQPANPPAISPGNPSAIPPSYNNICPKCGIQKKTGKLSCCAPGGSWFNSCGNVGDRSFEYTWVEGIQACRKTPPAIDTAPKTPSSTCPKCGKNKKTGKHSCCAPDGAWFNKCGNKGDERFAHTWVEGIQACKKAPRVDINSNRCLQCGTLIKTGQRSCCAVGGSWLNKCGNPGDSRFEHTWFEGIQACGDPRAEAPVRPRSNVPSMP